ncbi:MAG: deoxyhypusine synthase [Nanoarchaeota archaeon]|nr:deoxyhypusine synthase [Nanoarchaeota archaeon]
MAYECRKTPEPEEGFVKHPEKYLTGKRILPEPARKVEGIERLVKNMYAFNGGRLSAACQLLAREYSQPDVTIGLSLAGALTPAGLGVSSIIPLMNHGFVDWIVATGANMYHDMHFAFNLPLYRGSPNVDDRDLRKHGVTRIHDIFLDYEKVLMETDRRLMRILLRPEFQKEMGTQEFYYLLGKVLNKEEKQNFPNGREVSVLACAYRNRIPVFTSSPGDSTIGMNIAGLESLAQAQGFQDRFKLKINPSIDVNETTAIVLNAKIYEKKQTGVILLGGGSPKNFMLQTEPQIQEILGLEEAGQDYDINITDARADTGGLSGALPSEAVSWGKIDSSKLEESVVAYGDTTAYLPMIVSYVLSTTNSRQLKRLYDRREELMDKIMNVNMTQNKQYPELLELMKELPVAV